MSEIVDLIDNAIDGLCACGCGTPLAADGPSAWFASEDCQRRWRRRDHPQSGVPTIDIDPDALAAYAVAVVQEASAQLAAFFEQVRPAFEEVGRALQRAADLAAQLRPLAPEQPPEDPMARALWLRRNRNTGPKQVHRAPRRIDARSAR